MTFIMAFLNLPMECIFFIVLSLGFNAVFYLVIKLQTDELRPYRQHKENSDRIREEAQRIARVNEARRVLEEEGYSLDEKPKRVALSDDGELVPVEELEIK